MREKCGLAVTLYTYIWMHLVLISDRKPAILTGSSVFLLVSPPGQNLDYAMTNSFQTLPGSLFTSHPTIQYLDFSFARVYGDGLLLEPVTIVQLN
jgi:hypothetical protein